MNDANMQPSLSIPMIHNNRKPLPLAVQQKLVLLKLLIVTLLSSSSTTTTTTTAYRIVGNRFARHSSSTTTVVPKTALLLQKYPSVVVRNHHLSLISSIPSHHLSSSSSSSSIRRKQELRLATTDDDSTNNNNNALVIDNDTNDHTTNDNNDDDDDDDYDDYDNNNNEYKIILDGLNPSQIDAVTQPLQSITRVVAGPGAGKTRVLTCRIAYLLKEEDGPKGEEEEEEDGRSSGTYTKRSSRILAVTFTKKAAMEMQERLRTLLIEDGDYQKKLILRRGLEESEEGGDNNENDGMTDDDGTIYEEEYISPETEEDSNNRRRASPSLIDRVTLGTFHSVCSKILRWHGKELSSLPSVSINNNNSKPPLHEDNDDESSSSSSPVLDGSFAIIDQAEQMRIVKQSIKDCAIDLKSGGRTEIRPVTVLNAVGQLKSDDSMRLGFNGHLSSSSGGGDDDTEDGDGKKGLKMTKRVRDIATQVYPLYRKALLEQNSLDFDDLILKTRELLIFNPRVKENMRRRWKHVLVDEFQDTSGAQLDLIKLLTSRSLQVVGDGDQSIYSWRGAYAESMSDFVNEFDRHIIDENVNVDVSGGVSAEEEDDGLGGVNTVYLMENYRSTKNIVKAAQRIISGQSSKSSQASIRQDMKPMRGTGPSLRVLACADSKAEASFVVTEIQKMEAAGTLTPLSTVALIYRTNAQSRSLEEACVAQNLKYLVRGSAGTFYSRAEVKDCLCFLKFIYNGCDRQAILRAVKTPSRGIGGVSLNEFFDYCEEAKDTITAKDLDSGIIPMTPLDILISLSDDGDREASPFISPEGFLTKRTLNRLRPFASQMKMLRKKAQTETVSDLLSSIIDIMQLNNHFDSISKTSDEFADRLSNVMELRNAAERYTDDGPCLPKKKNIEDGDEDLQGIADVSPLGNFLDDVSLLTEIDKPDGDDSDDEQKRLHANLMTIHASKGMEFDAVFLVGNEEGTFPTQRAIAEGEGSIELEEERRLCYVAMTRAKTHLIMSSRKEVMTFFGKGIKVDKTERSRFLDALVSKKSQKKKVKTQVTPQSSKARTLEHMRKRGQSRSISNVGSDKRLNSRYSANAGPNSRKDWKPTTGTSRAELKKQNLKMQRQAVDKEGRVKGSFTNSNREDRDAPPEFDSTLFFPIGSPVIHTIHGAGNVIPPMSPSDKALMVSVRFEDGMELPFPIGDRSLRTKFQG